MANNCPKMVRPIRSRTKPLTPLMRSILSAHASGKTLKVIAQELFISYREICRQVEEIKRRLNSRNLAQSVMIAHKYGYIALPDDEGRVITMNPFEYV